MSNFKLSTMFNKLSGSILQGGARINSPLLVRAVFGQTNVGTNSKALRIAAENKSYNVVAYMLAASAEGFLSPTGFGLGRDWDKVQEMAKTDKRLDALLQKYEGRSREVFDEVLDMVSGAKKL